MSDSVRPHRRQPTRLPHPWDSPGKNTGVGCHFLLQCMKVKSEYEITQLYPTLGDPMDCSLPCSPVHGIFNRQDYWSGVSLPSPNMRLGSVISYIILEEPTCRKENETRMHRERKDWNRKKRKKSKDSDDISFFFSINI